jgi:hypothetical protein
MSVLAIVEHAGGAMFAQLEAERRALLAANSISRRHSGVIQMSSGSAKNESTEVASWRSRSSNSCMLEIMLLGMAEEEQVCGVACCVVVAKSSWIVAEGLL